MLSDTPWRAGSRVYRGCELQIKATVGVSKALPWMWICLECGSESSQGHKTASDAKKYAERHVEHRQRKHK
jgi:hypothetical protein